MPRGQSKRHPELEQVLAELTNMFGSLDESLKNRLRRLYNNPTIQNWENAYSIIVSTSTERLLGQTLWQAIREVDPGFPSVGRKTDQCGRVLREWDRLPEPGIILDALWWAVRVPAEGYLKEIEHAN